MKNDPTRTIWLFALIPFRHCGKWVWLCKYAQRQVLKIYYYSTGFEMEPYEVWENIKPNPRKETLPLKTQTFVMD